MTTPWLRKLYACAPGFKHDKDDDWTNYLTSQDQLFVRNARERFLKMKDRLDELKLQYKEGTKIQSSEVAELSKKIAEMSSSTDTYIKTLLIRLPSLKEEGEKAREKAIEADFNSARARSSAAEPLFGEEFAAVASSFDAFLPSHMLPSKEPDPPEREPEPVFEPEPAPVYTPKVNKDAIVRDTYLDGVEKDNVAIMEKMRPIVEKYDCRDRVLAALKRFRYRDQRLEALEDLKELAQSTQGAMVPMETSSTTVSSK